MTTKTLDDYNRMRDFAYTPELAPKR